MKYIVTINEKNYEVEVEKGSASIVGTKESASTGVVPITPNVAPAAALPVSTPVATQPQALSGEIIKSPLPGVILDLKVTAGASVKRGEILLIIEAMKMENEIVSPRDGVVSQIIVAKGSNVATNDDLLTLQ